MKCDFYKLSGSGNDFVMLDGRVHDPKQWSAARIASVCARGTGVGADGLAFLVPLEDTGHVEFLFYNSDGSSAAMCGNGALCATRLAGELDMAPRDGMVIEAGAGNYETRWASPDGRQIEIKLEDAVQTPIDPVELAPDEETLAFYKVGVPHLVLKVRDVDAVDLISRGRELRLHPSVAPGGANVNFVSGDLANGWKMRTYERGVEAETLACGTGAVACAAVLAATVKGFDLPSEIETRSGTRLAVSGLCKTATTGAGSLLRPVLVGPVRMVYEASLLDL